MRRVLWICLAIVVAAALALAIIWEVKLRLHRPRYVPGTPAVIPPFIWDQYQWLSATPFERDQVWLWTAIPKGKDSHQYLYDLHQSKILGELFDAGEAELCSHDGSRIMVAGAGSSVSFQDFILDTFGKMIGVKIRTPRYRVETFWILDIKRNSATRIGSIRQMSGSGSIWHPSPDFRYGYTEPTGSPQKEICVTDFDKTSMTRINIQDDPEGWWNEHEILMNTPAGEFVLLNVETRQTRSLFTRSDLTQFLERADLTNSPNDLGPFSVWNGTNYDFYFGPKNRINGLKGSAFLMKADRAGISLDLVSRDFPYSWGGHLDRAGTRYLFQGEIGAPGSGGNGAVYLRNLTNGTVSTIVPPDNSKQYAIPRFYGNEIIFFRNRVLHRIGLDGSNDVVLLK